MPSLPPEHFTEVVQPETQKPVRIIVAKADRTYAEALGGICAKVFPKAHIHLFTTGSEVLASLNETQADYLIIGLRFKDMDGIELLQQASQKRLADNVVVVAEQEDTPLIASLYTTRVDAIIDTYTESHKGFRNALRLVAKGQVYISPTLQSHLTERHPSQALRQMLTTAETRVLHVIGNGSDNQEASEQLKLSIATVQTHRRSIMQKFKVSTSAKLVFAAIQLGYAQPDIRNQLPLSVPTEG